MVLSKYLAAAAILLSGAAAAFSQSPDSTPAASAPAAATYVRPDKQERANRYFKSMFGYGALSGRLASAGISTWTDTPEEWGPHWSGFGKRFASNLGKGVIRNTTTFALEEAFELDSRYVRAPQKSIGKRIANAALSPFVARSKYGKKVFGFPRIAGTYTSSFVSIKAWYPDRYGWRDGLRNGTVSLGTTALFNLFKEFAHRK
jgi:hypothetical protein